ncbi:MAG TPA: type II toxin-antitoxin system prevent-host-death family antitoxin [Azospirillum sp.]|nr:type II toxin-antitoxin system prevent-host-death family antitoxin [Azospirillum sp.]
MKMLSVEEAKDQLAALVEEAKRGEEIVLTENGTPVAELKRTSRRVPMVDGRPVTPEEREAAWKRLLEGMEKGFPKPVGRFSRDEIYEDRMRELEERRNRNRG